jgi:hypothetical protein
MAEFFLGVICTLLVGFFGGVAYICGATLSDVIWTLAFVVLPHLIVPPLVLYVGLMFFLSEKAHHTRD